MSRRRVMMLLFGLSDLAKSFVTRVEADGGIIERANCIDRKITPLELLENGDFDGNANGWFLGSGWSYLNNRVSDISNSATFISQDVTFVSGTVYKVTYTVSQIRRGHVHSSIRGGGGTVVSGSLVSKNGTFTEYLESTGNDSFRISANEEFYGSIENVSIEEFIEN